MAIVDRMTKSFQVAPKNFMSRPKTFRHRLWRLKVGDQKFSIINCGNRKLMTKSFQLPNSVTGK
jgi:hypothetical protein